MRPQVAFDVQLGLTQGPLAFPPGQYYFTIVLEDEAVGWGVGSHYISESCREHNEGIHPPVSRQSFPAQPVRIEAMNYWNTATLTGLTMPPSVSERKIVAMYVSFNGIHWVLFDRVQVGPEAIYSDMNTNFFRNQVRAPIRFGVQLRPFRDTLPYEGSGLEAAEAPEEVGSGHIALGVLIGFLLTLLVAFGLMYFFSRR